MFGRKSIYIRNKSCRNGNFVANNACILWGFLLASSATTGVDVGVAVAVGACVAGGSMEGGLLLLAEPSGVVSLVNSAGLLLKP